MTRRNKHVYQILSQFLPRLGKLKCYRRIHKLNLKDYYIVTKINLNYLDTMQYQLSHVKTTTDKLIQLRQKYYQNALKNEYNMAKHFTTTREQRQLQRVIKQCDTKRSEIVRASLNQMYQIVLYSEAFRDLH